MKSLWFQDKNLLGIFSNSHGCDKNYQSFQIWTISKKDLICLGLCSSNNIVCFSVDKVCLFSMKLVQFQKHFNNFTSKTNIFFAKKTSYGITIFFEWLVFFFSFKFSFELLFKQNFKLIIISETKRQRKIQIQSTNPFLVKTFFSYFPSLDIVTRFFVNSVHKIFSFSLFAVFFPLRNNPKRQTDRTEMP